MVTLLQHSHQLVRTYAAIYAAVLPGSRYQLLAVGDDRFLTELWSPDRILLQKYQQHLRQTLPEGRAEIGPLRQNLERSVFQAQVWGKCPPGSGTPKSPESFEDAKTLIRKVASLARRYHLTLESAQTLSPHQASGFQREPVVLKFRGNDAQSVSFLRSLDAQGWNLAIQKISAQPTEGHIQMQMRVTVDVLLPAG
jgi:hypothetical protein